MSEKPSRARPIANGRNTGSGIYVDVENLRSDGQRLVRALLENWPSVAPEPARLALYVQADLVELWRLWAEARFGGLTVDIRGIQHFNAYSSKNSADIAIATNAIADLIVGRVGHIVVLSDDSDFISLYVAVRDEMLRTEPARERVPFLWVVTDRTNTVSGTVRQYSPSQHLYVLQTIEADSQESVAADSGTASDPIEQPDEHGIWQEMAQAIVQQIPVGKFKSTDCQEIIRKYWPKHPMAGAGGPAFGTEFQKHIWPILEQRGVKASGKGPIHYEMTQETKRVAP